jgi:hypothetical protein
VGRRYQFECGRASHCVVMKELVKCGGLSSYTSQLFSSCRCEDRIGYVIACSWRNIAVTFVGIGIKQLPMLSSKIHILNFKVLEIQSENLYNQRQKAAHVS